MNYYGSILASLSPIAKEKIDLVQLFYSDDKTIERYLLGRNEISELLINSKLIDGVIDDYAEEGTVWKGLPVVKSHQINRSSIIINCVINAKPRMAEKRIKESGFDKLLSYSDLYTIFPDNTPCYSVFQQTKMDLIKHSDQWEKIETMLFDRESKQTLKNILKFRVSGDYNYIADYEYRPQDQYFECLFECQEEVFVDCGGYDGDTTEEFCKRDPDYKKVYLFEPCNSSLEKAKLRLQEFRDIEFIELGVSNKKGFVCFDSESGSASCVNDSGSTQIGVTTLDEKIKDKVTFIKMDLEGWEIKALEGSKRHILEDHPKLAIAVYHHPSDFWRIPLLVLSIRDDYDVYLRHYTEGWTETVMYFVPGRGCESARKGCICYE